MIPYKRKATMSNLNTSQAILDFWFGAENSSTFGQVQSFWFNSSPEMDQQIRDQFQRLHDQLSTLELWKDTPKASLAMVILLDQFPRNMYRGTPQAFAMDHLALAVAKESIEKGFDQQLPVFQRKFLYMPFMHSEELEAQDQGVQLFKALGEESGLDYMILHRNIIARFGRFPHRNEILGRTSTPEEIEFLKGPNSSF